MGSHTRTETAALVALLRDGKRPWQQYAALIEERGSAVAVLGDESERDGEQASLFPADSSDRLEHAGGEIEAWEAQGFQLLTVFDSDYPDNLRAVHDRPPLIFVAGRLLPADLRTVAVVGARMPSSRGASAAAAIAEHLVHSGYSVSSGLAAGIDTAAHTAAIAAGGRTIAVIGTGLNRSYPPENAALQKRIANEGAVVSQFWPDAPPSRRTFPMRNAVMSGLSLATVVVEATHTSGARAQARLALGHGRPVVLLRSLIEQEDWAGDFAHRPGTHVVCDPSEITTVVERLSSRDELVA